MPIKAIRHDLKIIIEMVSPGAKVLDLGCGDGFLLAELAQKTDFLRGVEVNEDNVRTCISRGLSVRHGNIEEGLADFSDMMFDFVILSQTLAYLNNPANVVEEMLRVGKHAIISWQNTACWKERWRAFCGNGIGPDLVSGMPLVRSITISQFLDFLVSLNFKTDMSIFLSNTHAVHFWPSCRAVTAVYMISRKDCPKGSEH